MRTYYKILLILIITFGTPGLLSAQLPRLRVGNLDAVRKCDWEGFAGANAGARIASCIADLPSTGGTADARGFEGAQTISQDLFTGLTKQVKLLLGNATYTVSASQTIQASSMVEGNVDGTIWSYTGTGSAWIVNNLVEGALIKQMRINLTGVGAVGVDLVDTNRDLVQDVHVYGNGVGNTQTGFRIACSTNATSCYWNTIGIGTLARNVATGLMLTCNPGGAACSGPTNGPGGTIVNGLHVFTSTTAINVDQDTGGTLIADATVEGFTTGIRCNVGNLTIGFVRYEDTVAGAALSTTALCVQTVMFGGYINTPSSGFYGIDTAIPASRQAGQFGNTTLTGNSQRDFCFFGNCSTLAAQSGAFYNKLHMLGGNSETRRGDIYQVQGGNFTLEAVSGGNLEAKSVNTFDMLNQTLTANFQHDINLFGTGNVAQSGAFYNKLHVMGGNAESRRVDIYQTQGGAGVIENKVAGGLTVASDAGGITLTPTGSNVTVNVGVNTNGSGLKHANVTTGSINATSDSDVTLSWGSAFADANYDAVCTVLETTGNRTLNAEKIDSLIAASVTVRVRNNDSMARTGTLMCIGIHN